MAVGFRSDGEQALKPLPPAQRSKKPNNKLSLRLFSRAAPPRSFSESSDEEYATLADLEDAIIGPNPAVRPLQAKLVPRLEGRRPITPSPTTAPCDISKARHVAELTLATAELRPPRYESTTTDQALSADLHRALVITDTPGEWSIYAQKYSNGQFDLCLPPSPPACVSAAMYLSAPTPPKEQERCQAVDRMMGFWNHWSDERADTLAERIKTQMKVEHVAISLLDARNEYLKGPLSFKVPFIPRSWSIAAHTILSDDGMTIPDMRRDWRFSSNPLVSRGLGVCFYAGVPLVAPDGFAVGTIAVLDSRPHADFDAFRRIDLRNWASTVINDMLSTFGNQPPISASMHQRFDSEGSARSTRSLTERRRLEGSPKASPKAIKSTTLKPVFRMAKPTHKSSSDLLMQTPPESPDFPTTHSHSAAESILREYADSQADDKSVRYYNELYPEDLAAGTPSEDTPMRENFPASPSRKVETALRLHREVLARSTPDRDFDGDQSMTVDTLPSCTFNANGADRTGTTETYGSAVILTQGERGPQHTVAQGSSKKRTPTRHGYTTPRSSQQSQGDLRRPSVSSNNSPSITITPEAHFGLSLWTCLLGYDMMYIVEVRPVSDPVFSLDDLLVPGALEFKVLLSHGMEPGEETRFDPVIHLEALRNGGYLPIQDSRLGPYGYEKCFLAPIFRDEPVAQLSGSHSASQLSSDARCVSGTLFGAARRSAPGHRYPGSFALKEVQMLEGAAVALRRILKLEPSAPTHGDISTQKATELLRRAENSMCMMPRFSADGTCWYEMVSGDGDLDDAQQSFSDEDLQSNPHSDTDADSFDVTLDQLADVYAYPRLSRLDIVDIEF